MRSTKRYVCYGGARGGGKSHVMRIMAIYGAIQYPGIKILMIRRQYPELEGNLI
jgi:phage terminase large subunit